MDGCTEQLQNMMSLVANCRCEHGNSTKKGDEKWCSRGRMQQNAISPNIFWGNAVPPNDIRTRRNGNTVAFRYGITSHHHSTASTWKVINSLFFFFAFRAHWICTNLHYCQVSIKSSMSSKQTSKEVRKDNCFMWWSSRIWNSLFVTLSFQGK